MKTNFDKKPITWEDIEDNLKNNIKNNPYEAYDEKLEYFKSKILDHLDNLQSEEDKKIISFQKK